jgi:hypothetical protein
MWNDIFKYVSLQIFQPIYLGAMMAGLFIHIGLFKMVLEEESGCFTFVWRFFTVIFLIFSFGVDYFFLPHAGRWIYWFADPNMGIGANTMTFLRFLNFMGSVTLALLWLLSLLFSIVIKFAVPVEDK